MGFKQIIICLGLAVVFLTTLAQAQTGTPATKEWLSEAYFENYRLPIGDGWTRYSRLQTQWRPYGEPGANASVFALFPTAGLDHEEPSIATANTRAYLGFHSSFEKLIQIHVSVDRAYMNQSSLALWQLRAGVGGGHFWSLSSAIFAEGYFETFVFAPENQASYGTVSGWAKLGYRLYEKNHWIIDPLLVEARISDNSKRELFGPDYRMINLGPRVSFWWTEPSVGASLYAAKSWAASNAAKDQLTDYWLLFTLGVRF